MTLRDYLTTRYPGWEIEYDNDPWHAADELGIDELDVEAAAELDFSEKAGWDRCGGDEV